MKEFELEMRLRNNLLRERRAELGMNQKDFAEAIGISSTVYVGYENLRRSPMDKGGDWKSSAVKIAVFLGASPSELWPRVVLDIVSPVVMAKIDSDVAMLLSGQYPLLRGSDPISAESHMLTVETNAILVEAIQELGPREQAVIRSRFGFDGDAKTYEETGSHLPIERVQDRRNTKSQISRERVRQIEGAALQKLRNIMKEKLGES